MSEYNRRLCGLGYIITPDMEITKILQSMCQKLSNGVYQSELIVFLHNRLAKYLYLRSLLELYSLEDSSL